MEKYFPVYDWSTIDNISYATYMHFATNLK